MKKRRELLTALLFLGPNILGVMCFVVLPVVFAIGLAFTNWDLRLHNMFKDEPLRFVGLDNFVRLLTEGDFTRFLGNTLFLMMGIPFAIGGSLVAAILLSREPRGGSRRAFGYAAAGVGLVVAVVMLVAGGFGGTAMTVMLAGVFCGVLCVGLAGGNTAYRTFFYTPHFVAGAATFILWRNLFNPVKGPINQALAPVLDRGPGKVSLGEVARSSPWVTDVVFWVGMLLVLAVAAWSWDKVRRLCRDGDVAVGPALAGAGFVAIPIVVGSLWGGTDRAWWLLAGAGAAVAVAELVAMRRGERFPPPSGSEGMGTALILGIGGMTACFVVLGLASASAALPGLAADGLDPPEWLGDVGFAKPSLMVVAFWAAIGSNNMLLYLAALTNIPRELYEASDIDGAGKLQQFWHVTWPQLAPTTFFIAVMSTIGGLQGGFEMVRVMTTPPGGPAGSTTTLSYFIYIEGFETGRLSFSAAVAWTLFLLVLGLTMFNWKFGNKYVND